MRDFDKISNTINNYIQGRLEGETLSDFTEQLKSDPELKEEVEFRKYVMEGVKSLNNEGLRAEIKTTIKKIETDQLAPESQTAGGMASPKGKIISLRMMATIAAGLLILIVFAGLWYAGSNFSDTSLVASNHVLPTPSISLKGDAANIENLFNEVGLAYSEKKYEEAIRLLKTIQPSPSYNKAQFHLGNLYIQTSKPAEAIETFQFLLNVGDVRYKEDSEWLLVLAYLQNSEQDIAKETLNVILQDPDHSFYKKALVLNEKLDGFWRKLVF